MPPIVIAAIAAVSLALPLLAWSVLVPSNPVYTRTQANLQRGFGDKAPGSSEDAGSSTIAGVARRLTPVPFSRRLERLLSRAGRPAQWPLDRILVVKLLLSVAATVLVVLFLVANPGVGMVLMGFGVVVLAYFVPDLLLHSRGQERSQKIQRELPDTLDQMTIAVEAGLGFESAMTRTATNGTGPLAEELIRTLQDIQLGRSRRDAYVDLGQRANVTDLQRFTSAIVQADAYGISVADVLRTQAAEMRLKRRQRAEEKAMQIPVKVIFPLILFILPVLFIVVLGPAAVDIVSAFSD